MYHFVELRTRRKHELFYWQQNKPAVPPQSPQPRERQKLWTEGNKFIYVEGKTVVEDPYFDVLLSDVKNQREEGEEGDVTLGFEIRFQIDVQPPPFSHSWMELCEVDTVGVLFRVSSNFAPKQLKQRFWSTQVELAFTLANQLGTNSSKASKTSAVVPWEWRSTGKLDKKSPCRHRTDILLISTILGLISSIMWKLASIWTVTIDFGVCQTPGRINSPVSVVVHLCRCILVVVVW